MADNKKNPVKFYYYYCKITRSASRRCHWTTLIPKIGHMKLHSKVKKIVQNSPYLIVEHTKGRFAEHLGS